MKRVDTMTNPTVLFEAVTMYEALGDFKGALSVLKYMIERCTSYTKFNEVILRCAILMKHTSMHLVKEEEKQQRLEGLKQALEYFEYIIPLPVEGWHENDIMMQVIVFGV